MTAPDADRRALVRALALWPFASLAAPAWARQAATDLGLVAANVCVVSPETTEGPFYIDPRLVRRDITEGLPGVPLDLALQVVDADCRPVAGARVDIWHCDAAGDYSGFARQGNRSTRGETFLRGTQFAGGDGVASFDTIWPGWYRGRTPHIHLKVFLDDRTALTSQLFFPDAASDAVYRAAAPYADRGEPDTTNLRDGIARAAGSAAIAQVSGTTERMRAAIVIGVEPGATG